MGFGALPSPAVTLHHRTKRDLVYTAVGKAGNQANGDADAMPCDSQVEVQRYSRAKKAEISKQC